jgi:hypothetical protein
MQIHRKIALGNQKSQLLYIHLVMSVIALILIISRRPDAILNPQFWAEDGTVFYAQAYNYGVINSLFLPYAGYLHTVPRLTAALSMLFPLKVAPLIFNLIAIVIQIIPVNIFISSRFSRLVPNLNYRIYISFLYLALPGCNEINANITNAQWHIALLIFMAFVALPSRFLISNFIDLIIIFIGGLTGPFSILMMPVVLFIIFYKKINNIRINSFTYTKFMVLMFTAIIQMLVIITNKSGQERISGLGVKSLSFESLATISKILTNQLFLISIFGTKTTDYLVKALPEYLYIALSITVITAGFIILFYLLLKSPLELKAFIIFAALIPLAAIAASFPNINPFVNVGSGGRYWFNFILAFILGIAWLCYQFYRNYHKKNYISNSLVAIMLLVILFGMISDWQHPSYTDYEFPAYARKFTALLPGDKIIIPVNPNWSMELIKH